MLEENYCFDAEMYADEIEIEGDIDFREDQRSMLIAEKVGKILTPILGK